MALFIVIAFFIAIVLGIFIGLAVHDIILCRRINIGTLRMDRSDPDEPPYLFLELSPDGIQKLSKYTTVNLRVRTENYISDSR